MCKVYLECTEQYFTRFPLVFLKTRRLKVTRTVPCMEPFRVQRSVLLIPSTRLWQKIVNTSRANLFPLFIPKERTNMAAPLGVQSRNKTKAKQYFFCINIDGAAKRSVQTKADASFLRFNTTLYLRPGLPPCIFALVCHLVSSLSSAILYLRSGLPPCIFALVCHLVSSPWSGRWTLTEEEYRPIKLYMLTISKLLCTMDGRLQ